VTPYLNVFPVFYSVVEIPMFLALVLVVSRLRFEDGDSAPVSSS